MGPAQIYALLDKWLKILPNPFTDADRAAGYRYDISILQAEFSLTQMLDAPVTGRVFFEHVIRDNLDIGRADQVGLIFARPIRRRGPRPTPGRFRTRVITNGVTPSLHADYKHTTVKQYHKEGRALRTETTINDTRDFDIRKGLGNLPALREIGFSANRRLLGVQRLDHDPILGAADLHTLTDPVLTSTGSRIPGLPLGRATQSRPALSAADLPDPVRRLHQPRPARAHRRVPRSLDPPTSPPAKPPTTSEDSGSHGLIERKPHSNRYRVTDHGLRTAMLITRVHDRLLPTALSHQADPHTRHRLQAASTAYQRALDTLAEQNGLAA